MKDLPALAAELAVSNNDDFNVYVFYENNFCFLQNYWEPISTVMLSTNNTQVGTFYESYKNACAPNPVLDLNYRTTYSYFEDFLLQVVSFSLSHGYKRHLFT